MTSLLPPIFVLGCPRSGTTFLASLLEPTDYGKPFETHFITKYYKELRKYGDLNDKKNAARILKDILNERPVMQRNLAIDVDQYIDKIGTLQYNTISDSICRNIAKNKGFRAWGDKTPHYLLDIDIIYKLFPDSKFIYIVRDGRDVALSLLKRPWGPNNTLYCAELWKRYNAETPTLKQIKQDGNLFELRYEDLIDDAERLSVNMYSFLNQPYNESVVIELIKKVKKYNYNKWQTEMSVRQIKLFENIAANTLTKFGYKTQHKESSIHWCTRFTYKIHARFSRVIFLVKHNIIDSIKIRLLGKAPFAD